MDISAQIQRFVRNGNGAHQDVRLTELGSVAMTGVEPLHAELLRAGARFLGGSQSGATFMAGGTAIPTTAAQAQLWNGETGGNAKSYLVDAAGFWQQGGTTVTSGALLFAALTPAAIVAQAASASWTVGSASGSAKSSKARLTQAPTAFAAGAVWIPLLITNVNVTALLLGAVAPLTFPILVPPGYALGFAAVATAGTSPTWGMACSWVELELDIE